VSAVSALSNTSQRTVYNSARRPILRTGLRHVQLFLVLNSIYKLIYHIWRYKCRIHSGTTFGNLPFHVNFAIIVRPNPNMCLIKLGFFEIIYKMAFVLNW